MSRYVLRRTMMLALCLIISLLAAVASATSASAAPADTITSQYDAQSDDNLILRVSASSAQCDKANGGPAPWYGDLTVSNASATSTASISFRPQTGGNITPGESAMYRYSGSGTEPLTISFTYRWDVEGAKEETASYTVNGVDCDQPKGGSVDESGGQSENEDLVCFLNNYTDPSVRNEDGSYPLGSTVTLTAHVFDRIGVVADTDIIGLAPADTEFTLQPDETNTVTFVLDFPGNWEITAVLKDADGNILNPAGDCDVPFTVAVAAQAPVSPVVTDDTPSVGPQPAVPVSKPVATTARPSTVKSTADTVPVAAVTPIQELPRTGAGLNILLALSSVLLLLGCLFTWLGRKRTESYISPYWTKFGKNNGTTI